ncbi:MAG: hypothetical protein IPK98_00985 [Chloracidobacterium sp.]|nr:hypothetical protein [Chloracidobacterium sp.]
MTQTVGGWIGSGHPEMYQEAVWVSVSSQTLLQYLFVRYAYSRINKRISLQTQVAIHLYIKGGQTALPVIIDTGHLIPLGPNDLFLESDFVDRRLKKKALLVFVRRVKPESAR